MTSFVVLHLCLFQTVHAGTSTFLSTEYTTLALAKVWTDKAKLPSGQVMQALLEKTVEERGGYGKYFLFLTPDQFLGKLLFVCCFILVLSFHPLFQLASPISLAG